MYITSSESSFEGDLPEDTTITGLTTPKTLSPALLTNTEDNIELRLADKRVRNLDSERLFSFTGAYSCPKQEQVKRIKKQIDRFGIEPEQLIFTTNLF